MYRWLLICGVLAGGVWWFNSSQTPMADQKPSETKTDWGVKKETLKNRLESAGLAVLTAEGDLLHTHQHLDIWIDEKKINIPSEIGIGADDSFISPIHTHESDGIIHVESPIVRDFTLGDFFSVWGVRFDDDCIGENCQSGEKQLKMFVNGQERIDDLAELKLEAHQQIAIYFGTEVNPESVPKSYEFPAGY